jgi:hypothetical protein
MKKEINKIIYFDKETISNILQEHNRGEVSHKTDVITSIHSEGSLETSAKIKLDVPFLSRLAFLVSGRLEASFIAKRDNTTTISSTEISEFEKLRPLLVPIKSIQLYDIENSSTSLRVAGGYLRIVKGGVEGVDTKEFKTVMDSYDGYDTYKVDDIRYVRFNNSAFVSNYKRNDLLTTTMTLYCIPVGEFEKDRFDFLNEINKMERLISTAKYSQTLADVFPPEVEFQKKSTVFAKTGKNETIILYDVIYACILAEVTDER